MIADRMKPLIENNSAIRMMFEEGNRLGAIYGRENVFDFSLGNPNVPAPDSIKQAILDILGSEDSAYIHGYMSNEGFEDVREAVSGSLNRKYGSNYQKEQILMTVGAAGGMNAILKALLNPLDEVLVFAPYFLEYNNYVHNYDGELVVVPANPPLFQPDVITFEKKINCKTRAVIINSPNNPTGVIYTKDTINSIASILQNKAQEYGKPIYIISDEPYRELCYDGCEVPFIPDYYEDTVICYSFSKSLSLPGERIGYLAVSDHVSGYKELYQAANVANRILGYVNAPSLMQRVIMRCIDEKTDVLAYERNRNLLYNSLVDMGYECTKPEGAFYLFIKSLTPDEKVFCERAKSYNLLLVPGSSFACSGYVRIAYCVSYKQVEGSLPAFKALYMEYQKEMEL